MAWDVDWGFRPIAGSKLHPSGRFTTYLQPFLDGVNLLVALHMGRFAESNYRILNKAPAAAPICP